MGSLTAAQRRFKRHYLAAVAALLRDHALVVTDTEGLTREAVEQVHYEFLDELDRRAVGQWRSR